jgi:RNA polymerase sigma-70 factor, ECF subfamily
MPGVSRKEGTMGQAEPKVALTERSDEELIALLQGGATEVFGVIVERHQDAIINYATGLLKDRTKAFDIAQETFLRAYRAAGRYEPTATVKAWIYTIATRLAISEMRRVNRWNKIMWSAPDDEGQRGVMANLPSEGISPEDAVTRGEVRDKVRGAVRKLPEKYRTVVALRDLQGLSYEEIEQIVGCPLGTVKSRVNRGRLMLREMLKEFVEP